jgi:hypothetical protein
VTKFGRINEASVLLVLGDLDFCIVHHAIEREGDDAEITGAESVAFGPRSILCIVPSFAYVQKNPHS